jgi:hypothetical protein
MDSYRPPVPSLAARSWSEGSNPVRRSRGTTARRPQRPPRRPEADRPTAADCHRCGVRSRRVRDHPASRLSWHTSMQGGALTITPARVPVYHPPEVGCTRIPEVGPPGRAPGRNEPHSRRASQPDRRTWAGIRRLTAPRRQSSRGPRRFGAADPSGPLQVAPRDRRPKAGPMGRLVPHSAPARPRPSRSGGSRSVPLRLGRQPAASHRGRGWRPDALPSGHARAPQGAPRRPCPVPRARPGKNSIGRIARDHRRQDLLYPKYSIQYDVRKTEPRLFSGFWPDNADYAGLAGYGSPASGLSGQRGDRGGDRDVRRVPGVSGTGPVIPRLARPADGPSCLPTVLAAGREPTPRRRSAVGRGPEPRPGRMSERARPGG